MSLQVWLPLNGNLQNKGLGNINITNNNAIINNNGKIGKCYNVNNNNGIIANNITLGRIFSISFWIKINTYNSNWANAFKIYKDTCDYIGLCMNTITSNPLQLGFHIYRNNGSNVKQAVSDVYYLPLEISKWYHLTFIVNQNTIKTYQNGQLIKTQSFILDFPFVQNYILSLGRSSSFSGLDCNLNDFRLYDHALSLKEIKEISKGLVLHYPLDNNGLGNINSNLVIGYDDTTIYDCSGYQNNGTINNITYSTDTPRYLSSSQFTTANTSYIKVNENNWMAQHTKEMTINFWAYAEDWTTQTNAHFFSCTQGGGFNTQTGNSGYLRFSISVYTNEAETEYTYKYDSQQLKLSDLTPGWHMFTYIYQASTGTRVYVDGKIHHTYNNVSYGIYFNTNTRLFLGCQAATANPSAPYFNGKESDFRLYYTALSDQDISQLYYISALADRNSNFYVVGSYIEDDSIKITHSGNSFSQQINENSENKIYYLRDKSLHGNNFIQI